MVNMAVFKTALKGSSPLWPAKANVELSYFLLLKQDKTTQFDYIAFNFSYIAGNPR